MLPGNIHVFFIKLWDMSFDILETVFGTNRLLKILFWSHSPVFEVFSFNGIYYWCEITMVKWFVNTTWRILKDILKTFDNFKNKQKSAWSNVFWYVKVCIFWKCIQYTMHWDKIQILKKFSSDKINGTKMPSFSLASSNLSKFYF